MYANYTQDLMLQKYRWVSTQMSGMWRGLVSTTLYKFDLKIVFSHEYALEGQALKGGWGGGVQRFEKGICDNKWAIEKAIRS